MNKSKNSKENNELEQKLKDKENELFRREIIDNVREFNRRYFRNLTFIIAAIFAVLAFLGYNDIKSLMLNQIDIENIKEEVLNSAQNRLKEIDEIQSQMQENKTVIDSMLSDLQRSTEALGEKVFTKEDSTTKSLPSGWTFFAQKYGRSKKFEMQAFKVIKLSPTSPSKRSRSYPYIGDIVQCIISAQFIRTGPPAKFKMKPVVGAFKKNDIGQVLEVKEIRDSSGNEEIWMAVEPVKVK